MLLSEFQYNLPDHRIAKYPLTNRDDSKLLLYKQGNIQHKAFKNLPELIPTQSLLVFNNSKVVPARLIFQKETGAYIETFITEPHSPAIVPLAMETKNTCQWTCMVGNKKRWRQGNIVMQLTNGITLTVAWVDRDLNIVEFSWNGDLSFAEILELAGKLPIPPYLNREADESDKEKYQTIYSKHKGAVAAPTAGLHFTDAILDEIKQRNIKTEFLTLHVSAGTFKPVVHDDITEHDMHSEQIVVRIPQLENLIDNLGHIIAVGTTSMRTLESLYWLGVQILQGDFKANQPLPQQYAFNFKGDKPTSAEVLTAIINYLKSQGTDTLMAATQIFITPGYQFNMCNGLITNYHQPGSTLIMLVAAFIGDDWRKVYAEAYNNDYRFLSYGDSSLLLP